MEEIPISALFVVLFFLILLSAFFSGSETGLMTLNRYRLRHLAEQNHRTAQLVERLLTKPDRLIGLILLGNNLVNILAAQIVTIIALRTWGDVGIAIAGGIFTLVILIFAEVTPKTLAALHAEKIAFPAAWVYLVLEKPLRPFVWVVNGIANGLLWLLGVATKSDDLQALTREELRTVVAETTSTASSNRAYRDMLINILDLNKVTVEDIMVPRNEIAGIDLTEPWEAILEQLSNSQHTRLPVYEDSIDNLIGVVHLRRVLPLLANGELNAGLLRELAREPYFIPEGTPLHKQLGRFKDRKRRIGLVVDEYGDIMGLVTLEDILEEIVGEFTTDPATDERGSLQEQHDGSVHVQGAAHVRSLNRELGWNLPTDGPKTINGLILEHYEAIPPAGTSIRVAGYPIEILQISGNRVISARIGKPLATDTEVDPP